ncbi:unnamed protein product [Notodromas monacha]|uniref:Centrosome-associated FAM110 C-terminal domain-containing protein n=1 Tax=Notodromas monacha TaxID=399045 RepID=A0A7R9GBD6_9CRUS|nr:unnamed protein product [Notodromas monacha]CAG0916246.1 unnamed protein product [Notodromas monacha]
MDVCRARVMGGEAAGGGRPAAVASLGRKLGARTAFAIFQQHGDHHDNDDDDDDSHHHRRRKSAVELLAASKHCYVKSKAVLDSKQELKNSQHLYVKTDIPPSFGLLLKSASFRNPAPPPPTSSSLLSTPNPSVDVVASKVVVKQEETTTARFVHHPNFRYIARTESAVPKQSAPPLPPKSPVCSKQPQQMLLPAPLLSSSTSLSSPPPLPPKKGAPTPPPRPLKPPFSVEGKLRELISECDDIGIENNTDDDKPPTPPPRRTCGGNVTMTSATLTTARSPATSDYISGSPSFCLDQMSNFDTTGDFVAQEDEEEAGNVRQQRNPSSATTEDTNVMRKRFSSSSQSDSDGGMRRRVEQDAELLPRPATIVRSKSDISHRYSRGCGGGDADFRMGPPQEHLGRRHVTPGEAEQFFNQLGLHSQGVPIHLTLSDHSSPVFFDSISDTTGSCSRASPSDPCGGDGGGMCGAVRRPPLPGGGGGAVVGPNGQHADCSIVEKNARIIKWLFQCRRAQTAV